MLITEDNAGFISSLLDPHAEHLGYFNFFLGHFGERNSSEQFWNFSFLVVFGEEQF